MTILKLEKEGYVRLIYRRAVRLRRALFLWDQRNGQKSKDGVRMCHLSFDQITKVEPENSFIGVGRKIEPNSLGFS